MEPVAAVRAPVVLSGNLLTGIAEIDDQHRIIFAVVYAARKSLAGNCGRVAFGRITRDLLAYALYHFETEERLMHEYDYAGGAPEEAEAHRREHREFSERLVQLRVAAAKDWRTAGDALLSFLEDWLIEHIPETDQRLARYLASVRRTGPEQTA